jgi:hypothetical protein
MLTASHNPHTDNGLKLFGPDGMKLSDKVEKQIEKLIHDKDEKYLGCTSVHQLLSMIATTGSIKENGAILVLEINQVDYSLAQIAQIVESNNARILSSYIMSSPDSTKLEVTLKINKTELTSIIRTFERYDYVISASFQKSEFYDDIQDRFDSLLNFLKM